MQRLVQLRNRDGKRRVAAVKEDRLCWLEGIDSAYQLSQIAIAENNALEKVILASFSDRDPLDYDAGLGGKTDWRWLPAFDPPAEPARCLVTGTGLTHKKSAENRQAMHASAVACGVPTAQTAETAAATVTDSMKMYQWGVEGGRPEGGAIGVQPEWFYKGCGTILRAHGEPL